MEDVDKFKYHGSMFVANGQGTEEIRSRINLARSAFSRLQSSLLSRREISLRTKGRVYQAGVRSILLYGCERWPVRVADESVMWPKLFSWPRRTRVTSVRAACLYHYSALDNEKKLTSLYTSQVCVPARVALTVASFLYYNTHIYPFLLTVLLTPSPPGYKT